MFDAERGPFLWEAPVFLLRLPAQSAASASRWRSGRTISPKAKVLPAWRTCALRYAALFRPLRRKLRRDGIHAPDSLARSRANGWARPAHPGRTLLYFHGGGFIAGSPETHRALVARLVEASGVGAFASHTGWRRNIIFPAAVRDGIDAYRAPAGQGRDADPPSCWPATSRAAGLPLPVALAIRNAGLPMPGGLVALSPWADLSLSGWSMLENRKSDTRAQLGNAVPLRAALSAQVQSRRPLCLAGLRQTSRISRPIMVHAGRRRDPARRCLQAGRPRRRSRSVPVSVEIYDGMRHLFQADAGRNEARCPCRAWASSSAPEHARRWRAVAACAGFRPMRRQGFREHVSGSLAPVRSAPSDFGVAQIGVAQIGIGQIAARQPHAPQIRAAEIGIARLGIVQTGRQQPSRRRSSADPAWRRADRHD